MAEPSSTGATAPASTPTQQAHEHGETYVVAAEAHGGCDFANVEGEIKFAHHLVDQVFQLLAGKLLGEVSQLLVLVNKGLPVSGACRKETEQRGRGQRFGQR